MGYKLRVLSLLLLLEAFGGPISAETAISPAEFANKEGAHNSGTWGSQYKAVSVYASSTFESVIDGPIRITSLSFRPDGTRSQGEQFGFDNLRLQFSMTELEPQEMPMVFAEALATAITEPVIVYDNAWRVEVLHPRPRVGTRPFDFKLPLTTPFELDPKEGNLLVEWDFGAAIPMQSSWDASWEKAHVDQQTQANGSPNALAGKGGLGVVTQFEFESVEKPVSLTDFADCNMDNTLSAADLECVSTIADRDTVLDALGASPGDLDGLDGVTFADFLTLSHNFGRVQATYSQGNIDLSEDGVQFNDFLILSENFGRGSLVAGAAVVPEPSAALLLSLGGFVLVGVRRV